MTQEDKQLLMKDLCARLPYGVKYDIVLDDGEYGSGGVLYDDLKNGYFDIEDLHIVRPYLRPMSSMTKDEREEIEVFICNEWFVEDTGFATKVDSEGYIEFLTNYDASGIEPKFCSDYIDFLNSHHFDYRGLIEKGLALEAPEGMYKNE